MTRGAALALALLVLGACRSQVYLGGPDAAAEAAETGMPVVAACTATPGAEVVVPLPVSWGEPRAMASDARFIYVVFANGAGPGKLARVALTGGALELVAALGVDPAKIVVDDTYAYVTCPGSDEVQRVHKDTGAVLGIGEQRQARSIAVDHHGRAYWTLPTSNRIATSDFGSDPPAAVVSIPSPVDIALSGSVLFLERAHGIDAFGLGGAAALSPLAERCGAGTIGVDELSVYCAEDDRILRVDRATGSPTIVASRQGPLDGVLVTAGRVFWRSRQASRAYIMAAPLDGIGGPTILTEIGEPNGPWAKDHCTLFWVAGRTIVARAV